MNLMHRWLCRSAAWREQLETEVVPWVLRDVELGAEVLEVGPGPGLTTDLLRARLTHLTAIEIDAGLAEALRARQRGSNAEVIQGDATALPFPDARFSGAVCFTMLHHVPSAELQDRLLREVCRVLQPGGIFAGVDSRQSLRMRLLHIHDTLVPVDPDRFGGRLEAAGFTNIQIEKNERRFRFQARRAQPATAT
jgi:ubiquinone/menaquinone biosynthesis C-methylase UbiE